MVGQAQSLTHCHLIAVKTAYCFFDRHMVHVYKILVIFQVTKMVINGIYS